MTRLPRLDGLRGIAILLVLAWHYYACQIVTAPESFQGQLRQALSLAWSGVDLFFVLSGFLIAGILLDHRDAPNVLRVFYLRRICRIFPLYFLVLGLYAAVYASGIFAAPAYRWVLENPLPLWSYATFTQNIVMGIRDDYGPGWLAVTWSLAIEEQFYLVVPILVCFLQRRALVGVLLLAIAAAPLLRYFLPGFHAFVNTPWRADSLLMGVLLAVLVRWPPFVAVARERRLFLRVLLAGLLLGTVLLTYRPEAFGDFGFLWLAVLYSVLLLLAWLGTEPVVGRWLESPLLVWCGRCSFGIYMLHQPVSGLVHGFAGHDQPQIAGLEDAGSTLLALGITLALAALSYRYLEQPLLRIGHGYEYLTRRP